MGLNYFDMWYPSYSVAKSIFLTCKVDDLEIWFKYELSYDHFCSIVTYILVLIYFVL